MASNKTYAAVAAASQQHQNSAPIIPQLPQPAPEIPQQPIVSSAPLMGPASGAPVPTQPVAVRQGTAHTLHFGDLHAEVNNQFLKNLLAEVGTIESVKVCRDRTTRQSLGYAYVNFRDKADADRCIQKLNYMHILGQPVRITRLRRDLQTLKEKGNIFIKGLCKKIDMRTLHHTFSQFGPVLSVKIRENARGQTNIAFVQFEHPEDATRAINDVNGKYVDGTQVTVEFFVPSKYRAHADPEQTYVNLYVKPLAETVTEEQFKEYFERFGEISSCKLRMKTDNPTECAGFGFVAYMEHANAKAAVEGTHQKVTKLSKDGAPLVVVRMQTKQERSRMMEEEYKKVQAEREKYMNLYVKNLAPDVDDARLNEVFGQFGQIHSGTVSKENGVSKGFGFVCFVNPESAQIAIEKLNKVENVLGPRPLYVAQFQPKEARQAPFETPMNMPGGAMGYYPQQWAAAGMMPMPFMYAGHQPRPGMQQQMQRMPWTGMMNGMMMHAAAFGAHGGRGGGPWGGFWPQHGGRGMPAFGQRPPALANMPGVARPGQGAAQGAGQPQDIVAELMKLDESSRRQQLGESLHPMVEDAVRKLGRMPTIADKVTGMLIDLDLQEVANMLTNTPLLEAKVKEAIDLLENPSGAQ